MNDPTITENGPTDLTTETTVAPFDLAAARTAVASTKVALQEQETAIVREELRLAEEAHANLLAQCQPAQEAFDSINRATEDQNHKALQAQTAKNGAAIALDTHRRNNPTYAFGHMRPYGDKGVQEWEASIAPLIEAQTAADAAHEQAFAELHRLQGERRAAAKALERVSWHEGDAKVVVQGWRARLAKMTPRVAAEARPWQETMLPDNAVATLTSSGVVSRF